MSTRRREQSRPRRGAPPWVWALGVVLALRIAAALSSRLVRIPPQEGLVEPDELADDDSRFIELSGVRLHYKDAGPRDAPVTLVFLHGWASSLFSWRHLMARFSDRHRVIAFDRPGFGLSSRPLAGDWDAENPYLPLPSARQTIALMDALGVKHAVLVGHSQGSSLSVIVDDIAPERVEALVLVNTPAASPRFRPLPPALVDALRASRFVATFAPLLPRPFFREHNARATYGLAYHDPGKLTDETIELELRATKVKDWDRSFVEFTPVHKALKLPDAMLAAVSAPTLVVAGRNDRTVPYRDQVRAAGLIEGARLVTFESTGHVTHEERPEALGDVIEAFLAELT